MVLLKGYVISPSRLMSLILTAIIGCLFIHSICLSNERRALELVNKHVLPDGGGSPEEQYVERLVKECGLTEQTLWHSWRVRSSEQASEWSSVTQVPINFGHSKPKVIDIANPNPKDLRAKKSMELPVKNSPLPGQTEASDFLLGVSTTYERVTYQDNAMIRTWARWLTDGQKRSNGASLIVMLNQAGPHQVDRIDKKLQEAGIDAYVTTTEEAMSMARRYYELARILKSFGANLAANGQDKRWFGLMEDTVFFPSLSHLRDRLFNYNTDGEYYIGLPSERLDWKQEKDGLTTYGGGALLFTRAAIGRLPRLPCFEKDHVKSSFKAKDWDMLLQHCIMKNTKLDMRIMPGFYSPNDETLPKDVDSYETGRQPLLLHLYNDRHRLSVNKAHLVTNVCGEACFMQRYLFNDRWVLINGISISHYPDGVTVDDAGQLSNGEQKPLSRAQLSSSHRLLVDDADDADRRSLAWKGSRNVWKLLDSAVGRDGEVWQAYVKKGKMTDVGQEMDSVIVLVWEAGKVRDR